jgi:hypothetical protein
LNLFAVQQTTNHAHVFAQRFGAHLAAAQHAHRGVAGAEDGERSSWGECVDGGNSVGGFRGKTHAADRDAGAQLDGPGRHRDGRERREQIGAQQRTIGHPAARESQTLAVLCIIDGRDVADADAEFHGALLR